MKNRRGRPTIASNFLLGIANEWVSLLEVGWAEIAWDLLAIKGNASSKIQDVTHAMKPLADRSAMLAGPFVESHTLPSTAQAVRQARSRRAKLLDLLQKAQRRVDIEFETCLESGRLLEELGHGDDGEIEAEIIRRFADYVHHCHELSALHRDINECESELKRRETYVSQLQLLDYLHSKRGRVSPPKLAKALAGLPLMNWRQSGWRCRKFAAPAHRQFNFLILKIVLALSRRSILQSEIFRVQRNTRSDVCETRIVPRCDFFASTGGISV